MKRLRLAIALLIGVTVLCVASHLSHHRQIDRMLNTLDRIESVAGLGDTAHAIRLAEEFHDEYRRVSDRISCYIAHGELRESQETAALLPTLLQQDNEKELFVEIARLRSQLVYLREADDPLLKNIL